MSTLDNVSSQALGSSPKAMFSPLIAAGHDQISANQLKLCDVKPCAVSSWNHMVHMIDNTVTKFVLVEV